MVAINKGMTDSAAVRIEEKGTEITLSVLTLDTPRDAIIALALAFAHIANGVRAKSPNKDPNDLYLAGLAIFTDYSRSVFNEVLLKRDDPNID